MTELVMMVIIPTLILTLVTDLSSSGIKGVKRRENECFYLGIAIYDVEDFLEAYLNTTCTRITRTCKRDSDLNIIKSKEGVENALMPH